MCWRSAPGGPLTRGAVLWGLLGGLSQALAASWFYAALGAGPIAVVLVSQEATDEDIKPHRFTTEVAWLTLGSGLAFGLNSF